MNKRTLGTYTEELAIQHLQNDGYALIERNYFVRGGELDIIMEKNDCLYFIEVRSTSTQQDLSYIINQKKLKFIKKTIHFYLRNSGYTGKYMLLFVLIKSNTIYGIYPYYEF